MRKLFTIFALAISLLIFDSQTATAQSNTYFCQWSGIECYVGLSPPYNDCVAGFDVDPNYCPSFTDRDLCIATGNNPQPCIELYPDSGYKCIGMGNCQPCESDEFGCIFDTEPECKADCTGQDVGKTYTCTSTGCKVSAPSCDPYSDPNCYSNSDECLASGCTVSDDDPTEDIPTTGAEFCDNSTEENPIIKTALGCIPTHITPFINTILTRAVSIGAGIAFLLMVFGGFILITSAGNPENLKKGKDIITSAIIGLLFIIFSVFILRLIGIDILQIEGFK